MRCCAVRCGAVRCGAVLAVRWGVQCGVRCSAMQCNAVRCGAVRCSVRCAVQCGAVRCGAVRCGAVQCGAVRCGAVQCSAVPVHPPTPSTPHLPPPPPTHTNKHTHTKPTLRHDAHTGSYQNLSEQVLSHVCQTCSRLDRKRMRQETKLPRLWRRSLPLWAATLQPARHRHLCPLAHVLGQRVREWVQGR